MDYLSRRLLRFLALTLTCTIGHPALADHVDTDGDGLLDLVDVHGSNASGTVNFDNRGVQDLDGANLRTSAQVLQLTGNQLTSIEPSDFDGLHNLQSLFLARNEITSIESGDFERLTNLQELRLAHNPIASIHRGAWEGLTSLRRLVIGSIETSVESGAFDGLTSLQILRMQHIPLTNIKAGAFAGLGHLKTLHLNGDERNTYDFISDTSSFELNFTGASFQELTSTCTFGGGAPSNFDGFCLGHPTTVHSLVLDDAQVSQNSFDTIVGQASSIRNASLVGLRFSDEKPSDLASFLSIETLDEVTVDPKLFALYADEFNTFAAMEGNTVTVVPEPTSLTLSAIAGCLILGLRRRQMTYSCL